MNFKKVPCSVCNKLYDGTTHCSVTVCRACAMFFKRCDAWNFIPFCKSGNNKCKLLDVGRVSCSACRYQRCIELGLKRRENVRSLQSGKTKSKQIQIFDRNQMKMNIDLSMLVPETMPTLKRFCYHYAIQANIRKEYELNLIREEGQELLAMPGNKSMALVNPRQSKKLALNRYPEFVQFLNRSFPALETLDPSNQETYILLLIVYFFDLFGTFQTWRVFNDVNTSKIVCSEVMFADFENLSSLIGIDVPLHPMDLKIMSEYVAASWQPILVEKLRLLQRINITDVEYLAASALVVWDEDIFGQLPQMSKMTGVHRNLIYKDLEYYYRNILHLDNYVERVMNLKELIKSSKKTVRGMSESVGFLKTFNYFKDNQEMWEATEKVVNVLKELTLN